MNADSMSRRCFLLVASAAVAGEALPGSAKTDHCVDKSQTPADASAPVVAPIADRRMRGARKAFVNQGGYNRGEGKRVRSLDRRSGAPLTRARRGQTVQLELRAALDRSWTEADAGWLEVQSHPGPAEGIVVRELHPNAGIFVADYTVPDSATGLTASYGYLCFRKTCMLPVEA